MHVKAIEMKGETVKIQGNFKVSFVSHTMSSEKQRWLKLHNTRDR